VDDSKNLPEHEALTRRYCATTPEPKSEFTEKKLLYHSLLLRAADLCASVRINLANKIIYVAHDLVFVHDFSLKVNGLGER
jgi:hypothetical protein